MSTSNSSPTLTTTESYTLLSLTLASFAIIGNTFQGDGEPLIACLAFSIFAFSATYAMIRWLGPTFMAAGLKGKDMSKVHKKEIPETMGAVCAVVYIMVVICFIPFPFYKDIVEATSGGGNRDSVKEIHIVETGRLLHRFPHSKLLSYISALLSLQTVTILGIGDDLFDIRWRHKFFIPAFAAIPILIVYFVDFNVTQIIVPLPLRSLLYPFTQLQHNPPAILDLGPLYYFYMAAISIFCPNSINILAGINGLEVGQSIIIALLLITNDSLYLLVPNYPHPATDSHLFSIYLLLPFLAVSIPLYLNNRYPARVFVGDTYCYFAGMVFAVVGILGHFSKTLLLLFIPQIFNFIYSAPQLFRFIPCPRHRLPHFNARTGLLEASTTKWESAPPSRLQELFLTVLERCKLLSVTRGEEGKGQITESSNFTLINLWLVWFGPKREDRLTNELLIVQAFIGALGLFVRHNFALLIFEVDNLGRW